MTTQIDPELLNDLITEMKALTGELMPVVASLKTNPDQPALFENFGQIIDRIYGTAATVGLKELASYCGSLKKICYECGRVKNKQANARVLKLLETYLALASDLVGALASPEKAKNVNYAIHLEEQKAKKIHEDIFKFLKPATT